MKFEEVRSLVKGIPFTTERNAEKLYDFIIENKLQNVLELGFAHGTATCYIAAALDELNGGQVVAVDLEEAETMFKPTVHELLSKTGLSKYVKVCREKTGYTWFLHNDIQESTENYSCRPKYDL